MSAERTGHRFDFDPERLSPHWAVATEREAEWCRVLEHYLPRLTDYFFQHTGDTDLTDEIISFVLRRALLKLHEIGSSQAAWAWFRTSGHHHLTDLRRRAQRDARHFSRLEIDDDGELRATGVSAELMARVLEDPAESLGASAGEEGADAGTWAPRLPLDRAEWEQRWAALAEADRQLVQWIEVDGVSHSEAAQRLGIAPTASRKRHSRACAFLRTGRRVR